MRNLIVAGVSRSGKSILSRRLSVELRLSHIPVDAFVSTLARVFPQCGITHFGPSFKGMCEDQEPFLLELTRQLNFEDISYILDCYHILPAFLAGKLNWNSGDVVFLGYPNADPEQKLFDIRKYAHAPDWTIEIPDDEMLENIVKFIEHSRFLKLECDRLGLRFVDTSRNFEDALDIAFQELAVFAER